MPRPPWGPLGPTGLNPFRGIRNYQTILSDPIFWKAITNILCYAVIWVPLTMAIGLFLAVIVNQKIRGQTFFRASFYFPAIASSAAITTLFIFIMGPEGLFNGVRQALGVNPIFSLFGFPSNYNWLGESRTAMNSIIILNAWTTSGTFMLFYLASLQSISHEVYEAAAIDGANAWQTFWRVTFPLLRPGHYFVATVAVIGALQLFDQAIFVGGSGGEPNNHARPVPVPGSHQRLQLRLRSGGGRDPARPDHGRHAHPAPTLRPGAIVVTHR